MDTGYMGSPTVSSTNMEQQIDASPYAKRTRHGKLEPGQLEAMITSMEFMSEMTCAGNVEEVEDQDRLRQYRLQKGLYTELIAQLITEQSADYSHLPSWQYERARLENAARRMRDLYMGSSDEEVVISSRHTGRVTPITTPSRPYVDPDMATTSKTLEYRPGTLLPATTTLKRPSSVQFEPTIQRPEKRRDRTPSPSEKSDTGVPPGRWDFSKRITGLIGKIPGMRPTSTPKDVDPAIIPRDEELHGLNDTILLPSSQSPPVRSDLDMAALVIGRQEAKRPRLDDEKKSSEEEFREVRSRGDRFGNVYPTRNTTPPKDNLFDQDAYMDPFEDRPRKKAGYRGRSPRRRSRESDDHDWSRSRSPHDRGRLHRPRERKRPQHRSGERTPQQPEPRPQPWPMTPMVRAGNDNRPIDSTPIQNLNTFTPEQLKVIMDLNESMRGPTDRVIDNLTGVIHAQNQLPVRVPEFDPAKLDWPDYLRQFELAKRHYKWNPEMCLEHLGTRLKGAARSLWCDTQPQTYDELVQLLTGKYDTGIRQQEYEAKFAARTFQDDESPQDYMQSLEGLARRAYPGTPPLQLQPFIKKKFVDGVDDPDLRSHLCIHNFPTLTDMTMAASRYLVYKPRDKTSKPTRVTATQAPKPKPSAKAARIQEYESMKTTFETMGDAMMRGIEQRFAAMTPTSVKATTNTPKVETSNKRFARSKRPPICFCCGEEGHVAYRCRLNIDKSYVYTDAQKKWLIKVKEDPKNAGPPPISSPKTSPSHAKRMKKGQPKSSSGTDTDGSFKSHNNLN